MSDVAAGDVPRLTSADEITRAQNGEDCFTRADEARYG